MERSCEDWEGEATEVGGQLECHVLDANFHLDCLCLQLFSLFLLSFNTYVFKYYSVPGTISGTGGTVYEQGRQTNSLLLSRIHSSVGTKKIKNKSPDSDRSFEFRPE